MIRRALITAAIVTLAALPRLAMSGRLMEAPILFLLAIFVADAPAAWGAREGMAGLWPPREKLVRGALLALAAAALLLPLELVTDPGYRRALAAAQRDDLLAMAFPVEPPRILAAMLWSGGFEVLFFYAFVISLLVRATGKVVPSMAAAVVLRTALTLAKLAGAGLLPEALPAAGAGAATAVVMALLFVRGGLPAVSLLALLLKARHFLP